MSQRSHGGLSGVSGHGYGRWLGVSLLPAFPLLRVLRDRRDPQAPTCAHTPLAKARHVAMWYWRLCQRKAPVRGEGVLLCDRAEGRPGVRPCMVDRPQPVPGGCSLTRLTSASSDQGQREKGPRGECERGRNNTPRPRGLYNRHSLSPGPRVRRPRCRRGGRVLLRPLSLCVDSRALPVSSQGHPSVCVCVLMSSSCKDPSHSGSGPPR